MVSQFNLKVVPPQLETPTRTESKNYRGVINVRSQRSSGSGRPEEIFQSAEDAGLDWILLTDQLGVEPRREDLSGYHGRLLVLDGAEIPLLDNRYFVADSQGFLGKTLSQAQLRLTELLSKRSPDSEAFVVQSETLGSWDSLEPPPGLHGIELFNSKILASTAWNRSKTLVFWSLFSLLANLDLSFVRLYSDPVPALQWWDRSFQSRRLVAVAGSEASARALPLPNWLLQFPSYEKSFGIFSNHLWIRGDLTGNASKDRPKIMEALNHGHLFMSLDLLGNPNGFQAFIDQDGKTLLPGSRLGWKKNSILIGKLKEIPRSFFEWIVYKNGERILNSNRPFLSLSLEGPGIYRIVIRCVVSFPFPEGKRWVTWITTNPFDVY